MASNFCKHTYMILLAVMILTAWNHSLRAQLGTRGYPPSQRNQRSYAPSNRSQRGFTPRLQNQRGYAPRVQNRRSYGPTNRPAMRNRSTLPGIRPNRRLPRSPLTVQPRITTGIQTESNPNPVGLPTTGLNARVDQSVPGAGSQPLVRRRGPMVRRQVVGKSEDDGSVELPDIDFSSDKEFTPPRRWQDNTGTYSTVAQLIAVRDNKLKLLKKTGKISTVPARRLSSTDLEYVWKLIETAKSNGGSDRIEQGEEN